MDEGAAPKDCSEFVTTFRFDRRRYATLVCILLVAFGGILMGSRTLLIVDAIILAAATCFTSCQRSSQNPPIVHAPLPPPPAGELKYAGTPPTHPFAKQAGNYYARTVFQTDGPGTTHIEVRDVLIPPHSKSTVEALPGPAVMDPTAGKATVSTSGKPETLEGVMMRSLPAGRALEFENSDSGPAMVRLYIIRAR